MFTVAKPSDNRVDITLSGRVDAETMRSALDDLLSASEGISEGVMFYTITNFAMPDMDAIGVEMSRLPKLFGLLGKFNRCAVLTDAGWLKTAAEIESAMIPGLEIRAFDLDEEDAAEAWLAA